MKYRTKEQFDSIINNAINGNWSDAVKQVEEYGFYAHDLIKAYQEELEGGGVSSYFEGLDLALLIPDKRSN